MIDKKYKQLLQDIFENGVEKKDRTGTGTISVFGRQIRHKMSDGFPLLTTKKMYWKGIVTELLWFLRGDTNIQWLVQNNCNIWNGDVYQAYLNKLPPETDVFDVLTTSNFIEKIKTDNEFAKKWGDLGPIYGKQWVNWTSYRVYKLEKPTIGTARINQIENAIHLLKTDPDSRRNIVSAWNVGELDQMVLPPCHNFFQFYTRELSHQERLDIACKGDENGIMSVVPMYKEKEKMVEFMNEKNIPTRGISLMYNARSQDVPLGTPFNIASYGLLLVIIAKMVNMVPDELITNMGDCHIYKNQIDGIKEQLTREPYPLPKLVISDDINFTGTIDEFLNSCSISDFKIENYKSHPMIKMPLSN